MKNCSKLGILFLLLIISLSSNAQEIQLGEFKLDKNYRDFNLNQNEGPRGFGYEVKFETPFKEKPEIMISITSVDANTKAGLRYKVETSFISTEGFVMKLSTWGDSKVYGLEGKWIAIEK